MKLYLVQHGDAVSKADDPDRPLSEQGRDDVNAAATFLAGKANFVRCLHSGKTRARQTATILAQVLAPGAPVDAIDHINPNDPVEPLARQLPGWTGDTLLVGHLPFMARFVSYLLVGSEDTIAVDYRPGTIVCLNREQERWRIQWMLRPELLHRAAR